MPKSFREKMNQVAKEKFLSFSDYTRIALLEKFDREIENTPSSWSTPK